MLASDLAALYGVPTKVLVQAVKRNLERFPSDFAFQLTEQELRVLRSQIVTLDESDDAPQGRGKYAKYVPYAFTEQGVAMLSSVQWRSGWMIWNRDTTGSSRPCSTRYGS